MDCERVHSGVFFRVAQANPLRGRAYESGPGIPQASRRIQRPGNPATTSSPVAKEKHVQGHLPLVEVSADINVVTTTSRTVLTQIFLNNSDSSIREATYCFPLYEGSTIVSFRCWVGSDVLIEVVVKSKDEARAEFKNAVSRKEVATLLEEVTPEIFESNIGNIPAQTAVRVEIIYINELKADPVGGGVLLTVPTSIAPRYGTFPHGYGRHQVAQKGSKLDGRGMKIRVDISAPGPIGRVESSSHPISLQTGYPLSTQDFGELADGLPDEIRHDPRKARANVCTPITTLDRDFVLHISAAGLLSPQALVEHCAEYPNHSAMKLSFIPGQLSGGAHQQDQSKKEIIFVVDRSGSMWDKVDVLRRSLGVLLENIPQKNCYFNICSFGSDSSILWDSSVLCNEKNLTKARKFLVESFDANMGGTELKQGLQQAVKSSMKRKDVSTQIILLTDGEIWDIQNTVDYVSQTHKAHCDQIRFFALGIGDEVSHQLLEGIGRQGGGFAEVIAVDSLGDWDSRVKRVLEGALTAKDLECDVTLENSKAPPSQIVNDMTLDTESHNMSDPRPPFVQAPYRLPSVHPFSQSTVYFMFESQDPSFDTVAVSTRTPNGKSVITRIPIEHVEVPNPRIQHLAAKAIVRDLENCESSLFDKGKSLENTAQLEAIELGKKWSIAGKWTSFVGVDTATGKENMTRMYKADRLELSDLQKPRSLGMGGSFLPSLFWPSGGFTNGGKNDDDEDDDDDDENNNGSTKPRRKASSSSCDRFFGETFKRYDPDDDDQDDDFGGSGSDQGQKGTHRGGRSGSSSSQGQNSSGNSSETGSSSRTEGNSSCGQGSSPTNQKQASSREWRFAIEDQHLSFHDEPWTFSKAAMPTGIQEPVDLTGFSPRYQRLYDILHRQTHSGYFRLNLLTKSSKHHFILDSFEPTTMQVMQDWLTGMDVVCGEGESENKRTVCETAMTSLYIQHQFPDSKTIWKSGIQRAKFWLENILKSGSVREELEFLVRSKLLKQSLEDARLTAQSLSLQLQMNQLNTMPGHLKGTGRGSILFPASFQDHSSVEKSMSGLYLADNNKMSLDTYSHSQSSKALPHTSTDKGYESSTLDVTVIPLTASHPPSSEELGEDNCGTSSVTSNAHLRASHAPECLGTSSSDIRTIANEEHDSNSNERL